MGNLIYIKSALSIQDAALKAFNEAEFMTMTWCKRRPRLQMVLKNIWNPSDHGRLYTDPKNLRHLHWLLTARESDLIEPEYRGDLTEFDPVVIDITPQDNPGGLSVVRVLSEKLMPINFGYGTEHRGHIRMKALGYRWRLPYPSVPHFFA